MEEPVQDFYATRGARLSIVLTQDALRGVSKLQIEDEDNGDQEILEIGHDVEDDAVAPNSLMGIPLFLDDDGVPELTSASRSSSVHQSPHADLNSIQSLPLPTVDESMEDIPTSASAVHQFDVKTLMNLSADSDDDDNDAPVAPSVLSPTSASINRALRGFAFSPSITSPIRPPSASTSTSLSTSSDFLPPSVSPSASPAPALEEQDSADTAPHTPPHAERPPSIFHSPPAHVTPASFFLSTPIQTQSAPAAQRTPSFSFYCPPSDKPTADLESLGKLTVHAGGATDVKEVTRTAHVKFNSSTGRFEGLPSEWQPHLNKAFGLPLQLCATEGVPGYSARLPPVLVLMKKYLVQHGGLSTRGIFRLAPEGNEAAHVKAQLNDGTFTGCSDVNVIANLLKVWFRDMPARLLDMVRDSKTITECETAAQAGDVVMTRFREPHQSLLLWLLDLCADVSERADVNMMTPQNMAIVFAPNLFKLADSGASAGVDPIKVMSVCKKYTLFLEKAIEWRMGCQNRPALQL